MQYLQNKNYLLRKDNMSKTIILREDQLKTLVSDMINVGPLKTYTIEPSKVLIVKKFLDDNFKRGVVDEMGENGMPKRVEIVAMNYPNGTVAKNMYLDQLLDLLIDKYQNIYSDEERRNKFLGQVMTDWYNNKIGLYGSLSVNHL